MIEAKCPHFFDTDVLFFFICSETEKILFDLFPKIFIPEPVFLEAQRFNGVLGTYFKNRLIFYEANGQLTKKYFRDLSSDEYKLYIYLQSPKNEFKKIGRGESSAIAMAKYYSGVIVSSNYSDVDQYAHYYSVNHVGTDDILSFAFQQKKITMDELLCIRNKIISNGGWLPDKFQITKKYK